MKRLEIVNEQRALLNNYARNQGLKIDSLYERNNYINDDGIKIDVIGAYYIPFNEISAWEDNNRSNTYGYADRVDKAIYLEKEFIYNSIVELDIYQSIS